MHERKSTTKPGPTRTCAGCGESHAFEKGTFGMLRLVVSDDDVVFDLAGGAFGRGAYVHPQADCLAKAPRGLARSLAHGARSRASKATADGVESAGRGSALSVTAPELGARLVAACNQRMTGLLLAARRLRAIAVGSDAAREALSRGMREIEMEMNSRIPAAPLAIVAVDAGSVASSVEVTRGVAAGRVIAWSTKFALGTLLGEQAIAICTVRHESIAAELKRMHAAADAGAAVTR